MRKQIQSVYDDIQKRTVDDFMERLKYLKQYFDERYNPLKASFECNLEKDTEYIEVKFFLHGKKWKVGHMSHISKLAIGEYKYINDIVIRYIEEIKKSMEEAVRQEGINYINSRVK